MNLKARANELKTNVSAVYLAMKRKDTPLLAKVLAAITIGYALSPIDLIPDFIPVLGCLDDLIIVPLMITVTIKLIPKNVMVECRSQALAMQTSKKPARWFYAIPILLVWALLLALIIYILFF